MNAICVLFLLSSQLRLSSVSVTFDFNGPLNDVAPLIPKMFAVDLMTIKKKKKKKGVPVGAIVRVLLYLPLRLSFVSVVFDFNASSNDVAPASPMLFPVDLMRMENGGLFMDVICVVSFVFTTQIEFCDCCV